MLRPLTLLALALPVCLAGCEATDQVLFKGLAGEAPGEYKLAPPAVAEGELARTPPKIGTTQFQPGKVAPLTATATEAGRKTAALRGEFVALQTQIAQYGDQLNLFRRSLQLNLDEYQKSLTGLRLSGVRLPDNTPQFTSSVDDARNKLGRVNADLLRMNGLAAKITVSAAYGGQLREEVQALGRTPSLGEDDARQIETLDREVNDSIVLTHSMLADIHHDISQQSVYTQRQRDAIDQLADAVKTGGARPASAQRPVANASATSTIAPGGANTGGAGTGGAAATTTAAAATTGAGAATAAAARRPYVTISFAQPEADYGPALYQAVQQALQRRPDLKFEVVGVSPVSAGAQPTQSALRRARAVMDALVEMGLPPERLSMSGATSATATSEQVQLFVR
jgi:hypothetical protein